MKQPRIRLLFLFLLATTVAGEMERPNILFVFTDDQRYDAIGYEHNDVIQTPTLDRLARSGVVFDQCFVNTSICAVNRANVLMGQYPRRHGIDDFFKTLSEDQLNQSYPALLKAAGYSTAFVGKWGIGNSIENVYRGMRLFDFWAGASHQTCYWHDEECPYVVEQGADNICTCGPGDHGRIGPDHRTGKGGIENPVHLTTDIFPRKVESFLATRDPAKPFCLSLYYKAPHSPFEGWDDKRYGDLYADQDMPVPATATPACEQAKPDFLRHEETMLGASTGRAWVENPETLEAHIRDYYRLVTGIDDSMKAILASLEKHGVADNTVILFTSDNGHFFGEQGMAGKWLMREPSLRVPGFIYDPRLPEEGRGRHLEEAILTTDFTATILDLANARLPAEIQGRSFRKLVTQEPLDSPWRTDIFYEHPYTHGGAIPFTIGVRTKQYKYTRYISREPVFEEFFDLRKDPDELFNRLNDPEYATQVEALRKRTTQYAEELK